MGEKRAIEAVGTELPVRIGRYRIESELGRGGMAVVYRAVLDGPRGFSKQVCLKRILPGSADDPLMVEMFEREARIAATLQHANVVQLFDFDLHEGAPFLVMELVEGPSLWQVFAAACAARRPLPIDVACGIVVQVLAGLHHVHTRTRDGKPMGLVHRDVSLHNILVSRAGEVKVADFGIARATQLGERTRTGVLKGKLAYIAPEYAATGRADARADLFSVGVVLHELLSGRRRSPPPTDAEGLAWVLHPEIEPLETLRPDVPDALAAAVRSLVARLPGDRPDDAAHAAALLEAAQRPAGAAEIARCVESLVPARQDPPAEPTRLGPAEGSGETLPTPSPFDPTMTRRPTGTGGVLPGLRGELTPDASTAIPEPPFPAVRHPRRLWWAGALGAAVAAALVAWLATGPPGGESAPSSRTPSRADPSSPVAAASAVPGPVVAPPSSLLAAATVPPRPPPSELKEEEGEGPAPPGGVPVAVPGGAAPAAPDGGVSAGGADAVAAEGGASAEVRSGAAERPAEEAGPAARSPEVPRRSPPSPAAPRPADAGRSERGAGARAAAAEPGTLEVFVLPWAYVSIDGSEPQETPVRGRTVSAGRHRVVIDNPSLSCRFEERVQVSPGETTVIRRTLLERCGAGSATVP